MVIKKAWVELVLRIVVPSDRPTTLIAREWGLWNVRTKVKVDGHT